MPLPPIRSGKFSYGSNGLAVDDLRPDNSTRLLELLFPDELKGKRAQKKASDDAKKIVTKKWIVAQLELYGIKYSVKDKADVLKAKLRVKVKEKAVCEILMV